MHQRTSPPLSASVAEWGELISSHRMPLPATFSFDCYDARFDAVVARSNEGGAKLVVRCIAGTVPYSAESLTARRRTFAVIEAGANLPLAEITLDRSQNIVLRGIMAFAAPPSPAVVAAGTAVIAIGMKPILDIVEASRVAPPAGASRRRPRPVN